MIHLCASLPRRDVVSRAWREGCQMISSIMDVFMGWRELKASSARREYLRIERRRDFCVIGSVWMDEPRPHLPGGRKSLD